MYSYSPKRLNVNIGDRVYYVKLTSIMGKTYYYHESSSFYRNLDEYVKYYNSYFSIDRDKLQADINEFNKRVHDRICSYQIMEAKIELKTCGTSGSPVRCI